MADSSAVKLDDLATQVDQLSSMLSEVEENLKEINELWVQTQGPSKGRVFRPLWGPRRPGFAGFGGGEASRRQSETRGSKQATTSDQGTSARSGVGPGAAPDLLANLGSMFGKSPEEMAGMLKAAQQILGAMNQNQSQGSDPMGMVRQILQGMQGPQGMEGSSGTDLAQKGTKDPGSNNLLGFEQAGAGKPVGSVSGSAARWVGASAAVRRVGAGLPVKLQSVANTLYEAAEQDPFIGTAVHLDSRLRDMSDTIEGIIGILLLLRDIAQKYRR